MGDLKKRTSFAKLVNYVNDPKKARLIDSKDVKLDNNVTIAASMQGQADDKPGRKLKNPVYHISLDFAHEDTSKLTDGLMAEIAREYMKRMGIVNTQYIVCRHTDKEHQHLHIVANRVDNDGNTISDRNDAIRNVAVCKALTREYGLHFSNGKVNVKRDRLRGKDKVKYQIHDAVKAALPHCNSWSELCDRLSKQSVGVNFRYDRRNGNIIGVSFTKDGISFSGSRIDRSMGFYKIDRLLGGNISNCLRWQATVNDRKPNLATASGICHDGTSVSWNDTTIIEHGEPSENPASDEYFNETDGSIVRVTIDTLIELCVQPHRAKVLSGGGNDNGWNDSDKEKNKYKPRKIRR